MTKKLAAHFARGFLIFAPLVGTVYVVWLVVHAIDSWLHLPFPGAGLLLTLVAITLLGFLASNVVGARVLGLVEKALARLPFVRILYTSLKDLIGAFVGEKKRFDRPVMVRLDPDGSMRTLGFLTCDRFEDPRLAGYSAVYLPQSYNVAGHVLVVSRDRVEPIDADGAQFLAFILSGGIASMSAAQTVVDGFTPAAGWGTKA